MYACAQNWEINKSKSGKASKRQDMYLKTDPTSNHLTLAKWARRLRNYSLTFIFCHFCKIVYTLSSSFGPRFRQMIKFNHSLSFNLGVSQVITETISTKHILPVPPLTGRSRLSHFKLDTSLLCRRFFGSDTREGEKMDQRRRYRSKVLWNS